MIGATKRAGVVARRFGARRIVFDLVGIAMEQRWADSAFWWRRRVLA